MTKENIQKEPDWYQKFHDTVNGPVSKGRSHPERPKFDATKHLTKIQGKDYLEVKWRLVWMRSEHPEWSIETNPFEINTEKCYVIFRATIRDGSGRVIATGTKAESKNGFADYLEKAETGAVGRALALCGFGTQFAPELNEEKRIVDAPIERKKTAK